MCEIKRLVLRSAYFYGGDCWSELYATAAAINPSTTAPIVPIATRVKLLRPGATASSIVDF